MSDLIDKVLEKERKIWIKKVEKLKLELYAIKHEKAQLKKSFTASKKKYMTIKRKLLQKKFNSLDEFETFEKAFSKLYFKMGEVKQIMGNQNEDN